jgi:hypothetical protein
MIGILFRVVINLIRAAMMNRVDLVIENAALRQQQAALKNKHPRPRLRPADRIFWTVLRSAWSRWADALLVVKPDTVNLPDKVQWMAFSNPFTERLVGSVRRELLDHVVVLAQVHLQRLLSDSISYYHEDRCHLGLNKDTPNIRAVRPKPSLDAHITALPRVGGLHHFYSGQKAA